MATTEAIGGAMWKSSSNATVKFPSYSPKTFISLNPKQNQNLPRVISCSSSRFSLEKFISQEKLSKLDETTLSNLIIGEFSTPPNPTSPLEAAAAIERLCNFVSELLFDEVRSQIINVTVEVAEDGPLRKKLEDMISDAMARNNSDEKSALVLDNVVPCLIENADLWGSTRFIVASTFKESMDKLVKSESDRIKNLGDLDKDESKEPNGFEVLLEVYIQGVLNDEDRDIRSHEDLKVFLEKLKAMENITSAGSALRRGVVSEEKEKYSHLSI